MKRRQRDYESSKPKWWPLRISRYQLPGPGLLPHYDAETLHRWILSVDSTRHRVPKGGRHEHLG
jgi:hypothetical protein